MDRRALLILVFIAIVVVSALSFVVLKLTPEAKVGKLDRSEIMFDRGQDFLRDGEEEKAVNAFVIAVRQYPDSEYAARSLRQLALIYQKKEDYAKAGYYYKRLLNDFPDVKDAAGIRSTLGDINMKLLLSPAITEDSVEYEVQHGDTLYAIAKRFNTTVELIKKINGMKKDVIRPGQKLKINVSRFNILVDKSDNDLTLYKDGEVFKIYTVSTGKDNSTPVGTFKIEEKMVKPVWYKVGAVVDPDSEKYELGERWMGLSIEGYGIHGTSDESSIGKQITQGCVRMYNADVMELYDIVPSGTEVEIID
ncbi:MAG: L,D-transpeptidase family protein [Candidatus Omnitrophota bacterium]|jgi:lipoprotein-anchoring transpeptidase ErfK/SrfK